MDRNSKPILSIFVHYTFDKDNTPEENQMTFDEEAQLFKELQFAAIQAIKSQAETWTKLKVHITTS